MSAPEEAFPEFPPPPPPPVPAATWRLLEAFPVFILAVLVTTAVGLVASTMLSSDAATIVVASAVFELSLAGGVLLWIRLLHRPALPALGLPERPLREVGRGVVGGLLTRLVALGIGVILIMVVRASTGRPPVEPEQIPTDLNVLPQVLLGIIVVVGAPLGEELFFRGFLFRAMRARHGFWLAGTVSSAAFGLVHIVDGNWFLVPILFGVGLCFAYLYERDGRILTPIAAHATFNLIGILFITFAT